MSAITFDGVSKNFRMDRDRSRAFQEVFVNLLKGGRRQVDAGQDLYWALRDVSFRIEPGESVGLVGSNGAGKSTTLKLISRIIHPNSGSVGVNGRVSALLELGAGFHPELSGRDNIYLNGTVLGLTRKEINNKLAEIIDFADIGEFMEVPVKDYSSGMQARLGFSVAVHMDPQIVLVDEALAVGDQAFQQKCNERMLQLRRQGVTMLFVSHSMEAMQMVCRRAIWLDRGSVRMDAGAGKVSNAYYKAALALTKHDQHTSDRPGSGEARVTQIDLLDAAGKPQNVFLTNDALTVRIYYKAKQRIERPAIGFGVHAFNSGAHVAGPNNAMAEFEIPEIHGEGFVDYRIDRLPLLPGRFSVTGAIFDWDCVHCYDYLDPAAWFDVAPGASDEKHGLIALNGAWSSKTGGYTRADER
jgi:ABC-type polysaccharide/polyol phosphate transport system ATPase subunit